jgi:ATP-dependent exoDNAse (exonuclease V) beta subunit
MPCLNNSRQPIAHMRQGELLFAPRNDQDFSPRWLLANVGTEVSHLDPTLGAAVARAKSESAYGNLCRLYVGMTRAKHRLMLLSMELSEDTLANLDAGTGKADFAGLLEKTLGVGADAATADLGAIEATRVWQAAGSSQDWIALRTGEEDAKAIRKDRARGEFKATRYPPVRVLERLRPSKPAEGKLYAWRPASDEPGGRELGNLVHGMLQGLEWNIPGFLGSLEKVGAPAEAAHLKPAACELIGRCLAAPEVSRLLGSQPAGTLLWRERKAALLHDGKLVSAVFDRVHVMPGEGAVVIDYKTNDCSPEHLKELYQGQMDLYRIAVAKLCGLSPDKVRCVLIHVRKGELVEC